MSKRVTRLPAVELTPEGYNAELEAAPVEIKKQLWSKADLAMISRYYPQGKSPMLIGQCLSVRRSKQAVQSMAQTLGLKFGSAATGGHEHDR